MIFKHNLKYFFISIIFLTLSNHTVVKAEEYEATLSWSKRVGLSTPVNGLVQEVFVQPGKIVAKGDVLIQLDPRGFKADLKSAKAKLKSADEHSQEAKRELDRQTDMYDRTMLSEHELQIAKNNFTAAKAQLEESEAALLKAKLNLEYSAIRAPFNALVITTNAEKGQVVATDIAPPILVVVAEAQRMVARFYATADKVNSFINNQGVKVRVAGNDYEGKILNIALEPEKSKSGQYAIDIIFDSKNKVLRAGQNAKVNL